MDIALSILRRVRRARILRVLFAAIIQSGTLVGTCLLVGAFVQFLNGPLSEWRQLGLIASATIFAWCTVAVARAPWSIHQTACWLDSMAQTKSRFATLLALKDPEFGGAWRNTVLRECTMFAQTFEPRNWSRSRMPRSWWIAFTPWIALLLLNFQDEFRRSNGEEEENRLLAQTSNRIDQMVQTLKSADTGKDAELQKLIDEMRKSAERLRDGHSPQLEAKRRAFEQLAKLDEILRRERDSQVTAAEMEALLNALAANDLTKAVETLLRDGKDKEAAEELEKLAE